MLEVVQREEGGAGVDLQVAGVAQEGSSVLYSEQLVGRNLPNS